MVTGRKPNKDWSWFDDTNTQGAMITVHYALKELTDVNQKTISVAFALTTLILIHLNDLLQKASSENQRINFMDDIHSGSSASDVTDLVALCRNAACHNGSSLVKTDAGAFKYVVVKPGMPTSMFSAPNVPQQLGCDYTDDEAIFFGNNRIYLHRHIVRAFEEVVSYFKSSKGFQYPQNGNYPRPG
jgi:hypothetical protein